MSQRGFHQRGEEIDAEGEIAAADDGDTLGGGFERAFVGFVEAGGADDRGLERRGGERGERGVRGVGRGEVDPNVGIGKCGGWVSVNTGAAADGAANERRARALRCGDNVEARIASGGADQGGAHAARGAGDGELYRSHGFLCIRRGFVSVGA